MSRGLARLVGEMASSCPDIRYYFPKLFVGRALGRAKLTDANECVSLFFVRVEQLYGLAVHCGFAHVFDSEVFWLAHDLLSD